MKEILANITQIGGFPVAHNPDNQCYVFVDDDIPVFAFKLQDGPIKEVGINGCQIDTVIEAAKVIIEGFNSINESYYNTKCIEGLNLALNALADRKKEREDRGVEGTSEK